MKMANYRDLFYKEPYPPMGPPYDHRPDPYTEYCTGLKPLPPPPYPYIDPCVQDTYGHHCYHEMKGYPFPHEFPVNGPMHGSAFIMLNYMPYLYDNAHVQYGNLLNISESVVTRISRRTDPSCIDLFGTFDLTKGVKKNTIMSDYLCKCISQKAEEMHNYFNIMQSPLLFRLYYSVYDEQNAVVHTNTATAVTPDIRFHFTDIRDFYIQSMKSIFMTNIPAMDYSGIYRLHLDKIEVYGTVINTYDHIVDANPYYAFTDNNEKIVMQHDTIGNTLADASVLIASSPIDQSIPFQANLTTRLKLNFTAFLSELIAVPNTAPVYNAMFEPTEEVLDDLKKKVNGMQESITMIQSDIFQMKNVINDLRLQVETNAQNIQTNTDAINELRSTIASDNTELNLRLTSLEARVAKLEAIPLATRSYEKDFNFVKGQLTWIHWGELYQVTKPFKASGNISTDINAGYLVPLSVDGDVEMQSVEARLQANTNAITELTTLTTTHTSDITDLRTDLTAAQSDITTINTALETATTNAETALSTATAASSAVETLTTTVNTLDLEASYLNTRIGTLDVAINGDDNTDGLLADVATVQDEIHHEETGILARLTALEG
jgi:peptidoglycan hydrolase CwlO-like protein